MSVGAAMLQHREGGVMVCQGRQVSFSLMFVQLRVSFSATASFTSAQFGWEGSSQCSILSRSNFVSSACPLAK